MRVPLRLLLPAAAMALVCAALPAAGADEPVRLPLQTIDVLGRVVGPGTRGIEGVRVVLDGAPEVSATTDADGIYRLTVPVEPLGDPARKNVTARVIAQRPGWAFRLRNGQGALAIELRIQTRAEPARCRVRSNVIGPVDALAAAIRRGDRAAVVANIDFVGEEGEPPGSRVALRSEAVTVVGQAALPPAPAAGSASAATAASVRERASSRVPNSAGPGASAVPPAAARAPAERPDVAPSSDRPSSRPHIRRIEAQRAAPDTAAQRDPGSIKLPGPGVTQNDASLIRRVETGPGTPAAPRARLRADEVLAEGGDCACRIRGTVEMHPDHLLTKRLSLVVSLREAPAVRDTIQLFMGSPRAFELPPVRCGTWYVEVDAVARHDFKIVSADGRGPIDCREGGLRQLRVVLDPY